MMELAETGEIFGYNPREWARPNDNFLILGASGAGKSVLVNMLLAYTMLSGPTKGSRKNKFSIFESMGLASSSSQGATHPW